MHAFGALIALPESAVEGKELLLDEGTRDLDGIVIDARDSFFTSKSGSEGWLRSFVVERAKGYDFYYQLVNTGKDGEYVSIMSVGGFEGLDLEVTYSTEISKLDFGKLSEGPENGLGTYKNGEKPLFSAYFGLESRASVGFSFSTDTKQGNPANLLAGESSMFAVIHTDETRFFQATMEIRGIDTALVETFVPIPEPASGTILFAGSATLFSRRRRLSAETAA